jgi:hypothetical protein
MGRTLALGRLRLQEPREIEKHIELLTQTYLKSGNDLVLSFIKHWQIELETKLLNIKQQ